MKRILLPAAVFLVLAVPMQSASAQTAHPESKSERICKSSRDGTTTPRCIAHLQKMMDNSADLAECQRQLNIEYQGLAGGVPGKWGDYIAKQNDCLELNEKGLRLLKDAYVPRGDTSVRRLLRKNIKKYKALIEKAKAEMAKE